MAVNHTPRRTLTRSTSASSSSRSKTSKGRVYSPFPEHEEQELAHLVSSPCFSSPRRWPNKQIYGFFQKSQKFGQRQPQLSENRMPPISIHNRPGLPTQIEIESRSPPFSLSHKKPDTRFSSSRIFSHELAAETHGAARMQQVSFGVFSRKHLQAALPRKGSVKNGNNFHNSNCHDPSMDRTLDKRACSLSHIDASLSAIPKKTAVNNSNSHITTTGRITIPTPSSGAMVPLRPPHPLPSPSRPVLKAFSERNLKRKDRRRETPERARSLPPRRIDQAASGDSESKSTFSSSTTTLSLGEHVGRRPNDNLKILICSANLGNAEPSMQDMAAWIPRNGQCKTVASQMDGVFDMVVIGMQESTWSTNSNKATKQQRFFANQQSSSFGEDGSTKGDSQPDQACSKDCSKMLASLLQGTLGGSYVPIADKQRGQMRLVIFVWNELARDFSNIQIRCENTGIAGVWANKGGIVVSLDYQQSTRISFVAVHLAAHEGDAYYKARCQDMSDILAHARINKLHDVALSSHHCFVLGDLNFRTRFSADAGPPLRQALGLIQEGRFDRLYYRHDELLAGIRMGDLLVDFQTPPCRFKPTFKVCRGEKGFVYKKQRTPSYTDRVLHRSVRRDCLKTLAYDACPGFTSSDHKPIRGVFSITPNSVINRRTAPINSSPWSYRFTFSSVTCSDLPALEAWASPDPYLLLTWDFARIMQVPVGINPLRRRRQTNGGMPCGKRLSCVTLDPNFAGHEAVCLVTNGPVAAEAILYASVMDRNQDEAIATFPLDLSDFISNVGEGKRAKCRAVLDCPVLNNGRYCGRLQMVVFLERRDFPVVMLDDPHDGIAQTGGLLCKRRGLGRRVVRQT